ncbi:DUF6168 family protein [Bizionia paragorgiae]|jgi:hypothetical protein|uniref:Uncharacterized protein n=1 Tax=Bizionia paragorgiae TaxID=283786 RepID=A0A1H3W0K4_BIZPA|nr:DUF6168 family protein [Bizionia paragorgiae]MDX1270946.1 DUF6168 family protein [Bizionia paragorgiae]SDZ80510.1 hypothetical protein SAMN04487990_102153 [Bizionia paragorgiae]
MYKRILIFVLAIAVLFALTYNIHNYLNTSELSYSLLLVYSFHAIAAALVYFLVELLASILPNQAGYGYLMTMFFKIGFFVLLFQESVFSKETLTQPERIGLVIPLFIFLLAEAIVVGKLLNSK